MKTLMQKNYLQEISLRFFSMENFCDLKFMFQQAWYYFKQNYQKK